MSEQTPSMQLEQLKAHTHEVIAFFKEFAKNPVHTVANIPANWDVDHSIIYQVLTSASIGLITGLVSRSILSMVLNLILWPVVTLIAVFIQTFVLFHLIYFWTKQDFSFRRLYHIVAIAYTPFALTRIFNAINVPVEIVGVGAMAYLLYIAVSRDLKLPAPKMKKFFGVLFGIFAVIWVWGLRTHSDVTIERHQKSEEFNRLEKELTKELETEMTK